jgi:hypothetical protein
MCEANIQALQTARETTVQEEEEGRRRGRSEGLCDLKDVEIKTRLKCEEFLARSHKELNYRSLHSLVNLLSGGRAELDPRKEISEFCIFR